jgi:hypothetical protein
MVRINMKMTSTIDKKTYMKEYRQKNINKLKERIHCDICDNFYQKYNKDHHFKTKKHVTTALIKNYEEKLKQLSDEKTETIK